MSIAQPRILMLNGTSGVGKTTAAKALSRLDGISWIHPDGLWPIDSDQREIVFKSVEKAIREHQRSEIVIIDMQFRHEFLLDAFTKHEVHSGEQILLYCDSIHTEQRLSERGLDSRTLKQMLVWAQWLFEDSRAAGNYRINTSRNNEKQVVKKIMAAIENWGWLPKQDIM